MIITVWHSDGRIKMGAAVVRSKKIHVQDVDAILELRVGDDVGIVKRSLSQLPLVVDQLPGRPGIVGSKDAAVGRLDDGKYPIWIDW